MAFDLELEPSPFWRLAEKLSVVQAALLIIGVEPQGVADYLEGWDDKQRPEHYRAARDSVSGAVEGGALEGKIVYLNPDDDAFGLNEYSTDLVDFRRSTVNVSSLSNWLTERGFETEAFAKPKDELEGFRDPRHSRYSNKLAAVVEAWEQFDSDSGDVGTPKQQLMKWLRLNASRFELTDDDGRPLENVIEELAKVANWAKSGGAPKGRDPKAGPD